VKLPTTLAIQHDINLINLEEDDVIWCVIQAITIVRLGKKEKVYSSCINNVGILGCKKDLNERSKNLHTNFLSLAPNFISVNGGSNIEKENTLRGFEMVVRVTSPLF
jgi:hypothetical protein